MTPSKKKAIRPNRGSKLRPYAETPRHQFLYGDFTEEEQEKIHAHCIANKISLSQFLAESVIESANDPAADPSEKVRIRAEFEITAAEQDKLELLVRLHEKESLGEYLYQLLERNFEMQRMHAPLETIPLRFYLSEEEHGLVMKRAEERGIAGRNYSTLAVLRKLRKARKRQM